MSKRAFGAGRSLLLLNATLLATAIALPAFAQIEEVVVTAQKRAEDIQTVPISITAYSAQDLAARQIYQVKDLQFSTPSMTYSKGNFTSSDFSIRGIGQSVVSGDEEAGVATDVNDVAPRSPAAGRYAVVAVTVRQLESVGTLLADRLPLRFHHLR